MGVINIQQSDTFWHVVLKISECLIFTFWSKTLCKLHIVNLNSVVLIKGKALCHKGFNQETTLHLY